MNRSKAEGPLYQVNQNSSAFTLVELSIVLVIIGLLIGSVFVGLDMVGAASQRAQVTQIEKYNTAVNAFRAKFDALPGDMPVTAATQFGFLVGTNCTGQLGGRDGNGLLQGDYGSSMSQVEGEVENFWSDLSNASLIDGTFPIAGTALPGCVIFGGTSAGVIPIFTTTTINNYLPQAKIGFGGSVYAYSYNGNNWFGLSSAIYAYNTNGNSASSPNFPVKMISAIDAKIDDGLPLSGNVQAVYESDQTSPFSPSQSANAVVDSVSTCFNTSTPAGVYSTAYNNGNGANCGVSFKFQ